MGLHTCLGHVTIKNTSLEEAVSIAEKAGFEGFEFTKEGLEKHLKSADTESIIKLFQSSKIKPVCLASIENFMQKTPDEFKREDEKQIVTLFDILHKLSVDTVVIDEERDTRWDYKKSLKVAMERINDLLKLAQEYKLRLALEYISSSNFINCLERALIVHNELDSENLGLLIDTYHMYKRGEGIAQLEKIPSKYLFFVHLADVMDIPRDKITEANREIPLKGILDFRPLLTFLEERRYTGYLSVELFREDYWQKDPYAIAKLAWENTDRLIRQI